MTDPNHDNAARRSSNTDPYPPVPVGNVSKKASSPSQQLSSASSYADLNYLFGRQDPAMIVQKPGRNRRKSAQGSEHTKHRRTRSGCYTCRSRRVKCDETHPICDRCRKGGRECVYPESSNSSKTSSSGQSKRARASHHESPDSSSDEYDEEGGTERALDPILDEDEFQRDAVHPHGLPAFSLVDAHQSSGGQKSSTRNSSETPSLVQDKTSSPTPSSEGSTGYATYQSLTDSRLPRQSSFTTSGKVDWSYLPADLQFYLTYFAENITHLHYSLKYDTDDFIRTQYLDIALQNEALLYAVVGFSAFQRTLLNPVGKIQDFLQYYNKSVSLLLKSLKRGERHSHGTILAMLQLATIEEFLGDWVNLLGHQKAAYQILTELYTPQTIVQSGMTRIILGWYMRFDVFAGLMGGFETVLSREWFSDLFGFYHRLTEAEPGNIHWKIEAALAQHRLIATDMSLLFSKMGKGELAIEHFMSENTKLSVRIEEWRTKMDPALLDSRYMVSDFTGAPPRDPNDIVDPYLPGVIYSGPLWAMNVALIDWHSIDLMHRYQTSLITQTQPGAEVVRKAYESCQLFEAMEFWPGSPPGTMAACQASLGISCLFLPRDERHAMWARRKLAVIETNGYIYPHQFRTKMADLFRDRSCMHWWLPNDENYPPIIRSIRKFVEERTSAPTDVPTEDLRDMKAIFASLNLEDSNPTPVGTNVGKPANVTSLNMHNIRNVAEDDNYGYGYQEQQGFWDGNNR